MEENNMKKSYKIDVDCANCANKMEVAANNTEGVKSAVVGSLTLAHSQNSQMSFMYGFFFVKFLFFTVVCVVTVI